VVRHRLADDLQGAPQGGLRSAEGHLWAIFYSIKIGNFLPLAGPGPAAKCPARVFPPGELGARQFGQLWDKWPGGGSTDFPAFYSYAYPAPQGFAEAEVEPEGAYFDRKLGEFLLPYAVVRTSAEPETALMVFLESTYRAAADLGGWDRAVLECPVGEPLRPRPLTKQA
jgi:hypothetical protein